MKNPIRFTAPIALTLAIASSAFATQGVSPGAVDRLAVVEGRCPTFSWGAENDAQAYEIVGYVLPEGTDRQVELSAVNEVLFTRVTGSASAWTPSAEQCFANGGRYVWFVRSVTEMVDDQVIEAGEWSAGLYFEVPAGPNAGELERALEVLKRWEAVNGSGSPMLSSGTGTGTGHRKGVGAGEGEGEGHRKSVTTAEAAIRGEHPDITGEVYGVVGTSASADGAGVAAMNLDGGPDLVLDGLANGETDTILTEGGIDRASPNSEVFEIKNSGPGGMRLSVEGEIEATALDCPNCVGSATITDGSIIDNDLADDAVTEEKIEPGAVGMTKLQNSSVTSAKIADGSVGTADLSDGAVTGAKIADGAVGESNLRSNAVTTGKIADGTIVQADLALSSVSKNNIQDNAVVSGKILDGTIGSADLADATVTSAKIADGTIASADLADSAVTGAKIADGTIESADIGSSQVSSTHILNMGVDTADLAPGAVTSSKIEDGTITAVDVDPAGGVYASKSAVYESLETDVLDPGECVTVYSNCNDSNDLALQGYCGIPSFRPITVRAMGALDWGTDAVAAGWSCEICYDSGGSGPESVSGTILCISVPGP